MVIPTVRSAPDLSRVVVPVPVGRGSRMTIKRNQGIEVGWLDFVCCAQERAEPGSSDRPRLGALIGQTTLTAR
jgi:hypothetical protein